MEQPSSIAPVVVPPGAGPRFYAFGDEVIVHLSGAQTGGKFTLLTDITPPGGGPPPHYHLNEDEWFVVLEGRVSYFLHGKWQEPLTAGHIAFAPRGVTQLQERRGHAAQTTHHDLAFGFRDVFCPVPRGIPEACRSGHGAHHGHQRGARHSFPESLSRTEANWGQARCNYSGVRGVLFNVPPPRKCRCGFSGGTRQNQKQNRSVNSNNTRYHEITAQSRRWRHLGARIHRPSPRR